MIPAISGSVSPPSPFDPAKEPKGDKMIMMIAKQVNIDLMILAFL